MATTTIDAEVLKKLFLAGAANLEAKKEWINDLNVFPVRTGSGLVSRLSRLSDTDSDCRFGRSCACCRATR